MNPSVIQWATQSCNHPIHPTNKYPIPMCLSLCHLSITSLFTTLASTPLSITLSTMYPSSHCLLLCVYNSCYLFVHHRIIHPSPTIYLQAFTTLYPVVRYLFIHLCVYSSITPLFILGFHHPLSSNLSPNHPSITPLFTPGLTLASYPAVHHQTIHPYIHWPYPRPLSNCPSASQPAVHSSIHESGRGAGRNVRIPLSHGVISLSSIISYLTPLSITSLPPHSLINLYRTSIIIFSSIILIYFICYFFILMS